MPWRSMPEVRNPAHLWPLWPSWRQDQLSPLPGTLRATPPERCRQSRSLASGHVSSLAVCWSRWASCCSPSLHCTPCSFLCFQPLKLWTEQLQPIWEAFSLKIITQLPKQHVLNCRLCAHYIDKSDLGDVASGSSH